jgi:hypothetical protein
MLPSVGGYAARRDALAASPGKVKSAQPRPLNDAAGTIACGEPIRLPSRVPQTVNWSAAVQ